MAKRTVYAALEAAVFRDGEDRLLVEDAVDQSTPDGAFRDYADGYRAAMQEAATYLRDRGPMRTETAAIVLGAANHFDRRAEAGPGE